MAEPSTPDPRVPADLREALAGAGFADARWGRSGAGWEAVCFDLSTPDGRRFVLKVANDPHPTVTIPVAVEAEALRSFRSALDPAGPVHAPEVIAIFPGCNAYLMEAIPGLALHRFILRPRLPRAWERILARRLVEGLATYHQTLGEAFGDFHPRNLFVGRDVEPWFVDPVARNPAMLKLEEAGAFAPAAVDLGLFVKAVSRMPPLATAATPWVWWRLLRLTRGLVREAAARFSPADEPGFEAAVRDVALAHLDDLASHPWPRDRAAAFAGRRLLRLLLPRA